MTQELEHTLQSLIAWCASYYGIRAATAYFVPGALKAFFIGYPTISYKELVPQQYYKLGGSQNG